MKKPETLKSYTKRLLKNKKFVKAYIKLLKGIELEYSHFIFQEHGKVFCTPKEIRRFRKELLDKRITGQ